MTTHQLLIVGALAFASLAGCAPMQTRSHDYRYSQQRDGQYDSRYGDDYRRSDADCNSCGVVRRITKLSARRGDNTGSIIIGAVVGGALGNTIGSGDGRRAATVAGAVVGGAVANNLTRDDSRRVYYRIEVQMDRGGTFIFQQYEHENLRRGSYVEVHEGHVYSRR